MNPKNYAHQPQENTTGQFKSVGCCLPHRPSLFRFFLQSKAAAQKRRAPGLLFSSNAFSTKTTKKMPLISSGDYSQHTHPISKPSGQFILKNTEILIEIHQKTTFFFCTKNCGPKFQNITKSAISQNVFYIICFIVMHPIPMSSMGGPFSHQFRQDSMQQFRAHLEGKKCCN